MKIIPPSADLLAITPNAAQLIEAAGRTCYKSEDKIMGIARNLLSEECPEVFK